MPPIEIINDLLTLDSSKNIPLYAQVRLAMRQAIEDHFSDGEPFWTEQALTRSLSVSQITIRRALAELAAEGVLVRRVAKGTLVRKPKPNTSSYRVGVFVPKYNSDILRNLLEQLAQVCYDRGHRMHTTFVHKGQRVSEAFQSVEHGPDEMRLVLLANPVSVTRDLLDISAERGYRSVAIDTMTPRHLTDFVGIDEAEGVRIALHHLIGLGHERITLLVNEPAALDSIIARRERFEEAAAEANIHGTVVSTGTQVWESSHEAAYRAMPEVWDQTPRPTAILVVSDAGAWAVLKWLADHEIPVPQAVSVMGFDNDRLSLFTRPSLTTLNQNTSQIAENAMDLLGSPKSLRREVRVAPSLIRRDSTGPAPDSDGPRESQSLAVLKGGIAPKEVKHHS